MSGNTKADLQDELDAAKAELEQSKGTIALHEGHIAELQAQLASAPSVDASPAEVPAEPVAEGKVEEASTVPGATHVCIFGGACACDDPIEGHGCPKAGHVQTEVCLAAITHGGGDSSGSHKCVSGHFCSCEEVGGPNPPINGHGCPTPFHSVAL